MGFDEDGTEHALQSTESDSDGIFDSYFSQRNNEPQSNNEMERYIVNKINQVISALLYEIRYELTFILISRAKNLISFNGGRIIGIFSRSSRNFF